MRSYYILAAVLLLAMTGALVYVFLNFGTKTATIRQNIKNVETFENIKSLEAPKDPFGKIESLAGNIDTKDATLASSSGKAQDDDEKQEIKLLYSIESAGVCTDVAKYKYAWLDKSSGNLMAKNYLDEAHKNIMSQSSFSVLGAFCVKDFVIRKILNNDFSVSFDLVKVGDNSLMYELDASTKECKPYKGNTILCSRKSGAGLDFVKTDLDTEKESVVYSIPIEDINFEYKNDTLFIAQKPSKYKTSLLLSVKDGKAVPIVKARSLTFKVSDDAKYIYYSSLKEGVTRSFVLDIENDELYELPLASVADKCAFSSDSKMLLCAIPKDPKPLDDIDSYYKYLSFTDDEFYILNLEDMKMTKLSFDGLLGETLDVQDILWSKDKKSFIFIDRKALKPWGASVRASSFSSKLEGGDENANGKTQEN